MLSKEACVSIRQLAKTKTKMGESVSVDQSVILIRTREVATAGSSTDTDEARGFGGA